MNMDKKSLQRIIPRLSGRRMMSEECFLRKKIFAGASDDRHMRTKDRSLPDEEVAEHESRRGSALSSCRLKRGL